MLFSNPHFTFATGLNNQREAMNDIEQFEAEDLVAHALYLLQLIQQDLNMGRKTTVWSRAKRVAELCAQLEKLEHKKLTAQIK